MRLSLTALAIALSCIYWSVSGTLVEVMVRPGDDVTLYCDREINLAQQIYWVRSCSLRIQPPLIISGYNNLLQPTARFSVSQNIINKTYDLVIENITEDDLGLYYCAAVENETYEHKGITFVREKYHAGSTLTKITYDNTDKDDDEEHLDSSESDCWWCWLMLQTVCPASSLLLAILAFLCGYCCCHKTVPNEPEGLPSSSEMQRQWVHEEDDHDVCYASLNIPKRGKKQTRSQMTNSDFSVYNDIKRTHE